MQPSMPFLHSACPSAEHWHLYKGRHRIGIAFKEDFDSYVLNAVSQPCNQSRCSS